MTMLLFLLANLADFLATGIAMAMPGYQELGVGASSWFATGQEATVYVSKMAITAALIGCYALVVTRPGIWQSVASRVLKAGATIVWTVVAWNLLNITLTLMAF